MASSISSNISAYYAQSNLTRASEKTQTSISRLSSGNKITRASDDVAALSIGTILRTDVSTLKTALVNANQGSTLLQIADGALARVGEILQRQKALATQALSGTLGVKERGYLNQEFQALKDELDRIVDATNFNGTKLINGNLLSGGSIVTQEAAASAITAELTDSDDTIDSAVLANGVDALEVTNNGTANNSTLNKLFGSLADATVSIIDGTAVDTTATISVTINGVTFASAAEGIDLTSANTVSLTANDGSGVILSLDVADLGYDTPTATQVTAAEDNIQEQLRKLSLYQEKAISTTDTDEGSIVAADVEGTALEGLTGSSITIRGSSGFTENSASISSSSDTTITALAPSLSNFKVTSHSSTLASFSVEVGGVTYFAKNATVDDDLTTAGHDFGTDPDGNDLSPSAGHLRLYNLDNVQEYVDINFADINDGLGITTQTGADAFAEAFNNILGAGTSGGAKFAIGTDVSDSITVSIEGVGTNKLYVDENDNLQDLDITTSANATTASEVLDLAIQRVTSRRADVGALQSRFNYAAAAIEVSIQNLDAARGVFLDADISEESTNFATAQVLQQASISVLAQANQLPQNLLKLIG